MSADTINNSLLIEYLYDLIPAYQEVTGTILRGADLAEITDGLRTNNLLHYTHLLTGKLYM